MDIRVNPKYFEKVKSALGRSTAIRRDLVAVNSDPEVETAVMVRKNGEGQMVEWFRGLDHALSFIESGTVRIVKFCPHLRRTCIAEKCALYVHRGDVKDCAHVWAALR